MVTQRNRNWQQGDFFRQSFGREHIEKWGNRLRKYMEKKRELFCSVEREEEYGLTSSWEGRCY